jgi:alkylation response protein AidB-like acyl-CoA dehydrogenase
MGLRAARTGRLALDGVVVPADNLLGTAQDHLDVVRRARLAWAAAACGTAQGALDQLVPYVLQRHAFGEPIAHRQAVAFALSDIAIELAGLRLVVWRAAARLDRGSHPSDTSDPSETLGPGGTGDPRDPRENRGSAGRGDPDGTAQLVAHARRLTATHAAQIGSQAVQLLGGHGFVKEFDNERWFRDLRGAGVLEGVLLI